MRSLCVLALGLLALHCHGTKPPGTAPVPPPPGPASAPSSRDALAELRADMDPGADPCQDFYRFACGGWLARTEIPPDEALWTRSFGPIGERNRQTLREVLEGAAASPGGDPERARLGAFYAACMNEDEIERTGLDPLRNLLRKIEEIREPYTLMSVTGQLHSIGIQAFFGLHVDADRADPGRAIVFLLQGGLGLPGREYYLEDGSRIRSLRGDYQRHVARMLELSGQNAAHAAANAEMVLAFETEIARISLPRAELSDPRKTYHKIDRAGLAQRTPGMRWEAFFNGVGAPDVQDLSVDPPEYFEKLATLLAGTRLRNLKAYLRWQLIHGLGKDLPRAFAEESFAFYGAELEGRRQIAPRWKRCVEAADRSLGEVLRSAFVERSLPEESQVLAREMLEGVESALEETLPGLGWMDASTRERAAQKLGTLANPVGVPEGFPGYGEVAIEPATHLLNVIVASNFEVRRQIARVGKPVERGAWPATPATVGADYDPTRSALVLPAGILQPPLLDARSSPPLSYGGIGTLIGHELARGFDDWWGAEPAAGFDERARCVEEHYSGYEVQPGLRLDARRTLAENIADLGGIRLAYRAWQGQAGRAGAPGPSVAGLTAEQLFFVAFAQIWCAKATPEIERILATSDPHAPPRIRVLGSLSSVPEFARAFHCAAGTPMRPARVCEVW